MVTSKHCNNTHVFYAVSNAGSNHTIQQFYIRRFQLMHGLIGAIKMYRGIKVKINGKLYYKISLDGVRKSVLRLCYDSKSPHRGSNRDLPCYEAG
jgi:hypothetical protein